MERAPLTGLEVVDLRKRFGRTVAVRQVSFTVSPSDVVAILGPSGCGKSTVLHLIAGLEEPDEGNILWQNQSVIGVPPHRRNFGLMFQDFALFPHMDVADNVGFGLRMKDQSRGEIERRVDETLDLVGLSGLGDRSVDELSGGERQRVALARSLAPEPELLMLDEPLGSLDRTLKERLMLELPQILRRTEQTVLYVTHDQEEAFAVADRIVVMQSGRVAQIGRPQEIYRRPNSRFVAGFLGLDNLIVGQAKSGPSGSIIHTPFGSLERDEHLEGEVTLLLRPEAASLDSDEGWLLSGRLVERSFRGSTQRVILRLNDGAEFSFDFGANEPLPSLGQELSVRLAVPQGVQLLA